MDPSVVKQSVEKFFLSLNDYAVDKWGDVGSWVWEQGMIALEFFFTNFYTKLNKEQRDKVFSEEE